MVNEGLKLTGSPANIAQSAGGMPALIDLSSAFNPSAQVRLTDGSDVSVSRKRSASALARKMSPSGHHDF
jgi:hypothetical protein